MHIVIRAHTIYDAFVLIGYVTLRIHRETKHYSKKNSSQHDAMTFTGKLNTVLGTHTYICEGTQTLVG